MKARLTTWLAATLFFAAVGIGSATPGVPRSPYQLTLTKPMQSKQTSITLRCQPGDRAISGGYSAPFVAVVTTDTYTFGGQQHYPDGWRVVAHLSHHPTRPVVLTATATCFPGG